MFVISGISLRPTVRAARVTLGLLSGLGLLITSSVAQTESSAAEVQQVVVTATRFPTPLSRLPADVQIITAEQIAESGATSVNEALMRILGIPGRLDLNGGGDYALDLRGFGERADNNQVIVVDGLRLSEPDMGGTRLAGIPIETVTRIEVLRGSSAVLYGEGATAGAIVVTTTAFAGGPRDEAPSFKGSVQLGRGNMSSNDASGNARWSQGALSVSGAIKNAASDNHRPNAQSKAESGEFAVNWREADWSVGLKHVTDRSDARLPGALSYASFLTDPFSTQSKYLDNYAKIDSDRTQIHAQTQVADWRLSAEWSSRQKALESLTTFGSSSSRFDSDIYAKDLSVKASTPWQLGGFQQQTSLGMDQRKWDRTTNFGVSTSEATGWFVRQEMALSPETRLLAGVRSDEIQRTSSDTEDLATRLNVWDLGLNKRLFKAGTLWARLGSSYRVPSVDELSYSYTGDPNLKPQTSLDQEAGLRWGADGYMADVRVYRNMLSNEIAFDSINFKNVNLDPTLRQGVEADLTIPVSQDWQVQPHLAWRQAQFRQGSMKGKSVPLVAPQALGLRLLGSLANGHVVSGGVNLVGSQYVDNDNTCKISSYTTVDARYAYKWRDLEASVGIANLLDKRYFTTAYNCLGGLPKDVYPELGRTLAARLKVAF
jgi:iron complex outermembrane recepter protein